MGGRILGQRKPDPSAHGIAEVVGRGQGERIKHGHHICHLMLHRIDSGIVGLVAGPVAPCVDEDQPIVVLQGGDVAHLIPALQAIGKPVLEHERWPLTFHLVMDTEAVVIGIWHSSDLPLHTLVWQHALLTT